MLASYPDLPISEIVNGVEIRKTGQTFGAPNVATASRLIYRKFNLTEIPCGTFAKTTDVNNYVNLYRYCDVGLDWMFVFVAPKWEFIGEMIYAIIAALTSSVVIVISGVIIGTSASFRIVRPFQNLIDLFSSVSNMNLENVKIPLSPFNEVYHLQQHFRLMIKRIKQVSTT